MCGSKAGLPTDSQLYTKYVNTPNFSKVHNSVFTLCFVSEGAGVGVGVGGGETWGGEGERKREGECVCTCIRRKT